MRAPDQPTSRFEFIVLLALMTSIVAMSTDIMLPALNEISRDLAAPGANDGQLIVSALFVGLAVGQLLVGPLSDSLGRRPVLFMGYGIFMLGTGLTLVTTDFTTMLIGRVLQGLGASGPRVIAMAVIRDCYQGRQMAQVLSVITAVFILVPAVAPSIGQLIIFAAGWRAVFAFLGLIALITFGWYALRQPETLPLDARRSFALRDIGRGIAEALGHRVTLGTTLAIGFLFAPFIGYLSSAQQIFQETYDKGTEFPLWFASAALCFGAASLVNARLVMRLGMRALTGWALLALVAGTLLCLAAVAFTQGRPPFWGFFLWLAPALFCVGIAFGNLNALAMDPLGHMAGLGAALVGSISTFIAVPLGWAVGQGFDGGIGALVTGFGACGAVSYLCFAWAARHVADAPD
ncbi:MAG: multidrug effflux MFS transporter [Paracoccaceae bacterium]